MGWRDILARAGLLAAVALITAGCGEADEPPVPTLMVLPEWTPPPTFTPSITPTASPTPPPTATATSTTTLTPTASPSPIPPSATPTGTATPAPTFTPTPVQIVISSEVGAYARTGPGTAFDVAGTVGAGQRFAALAYAADDEGTVWYLVALAPGQAAWVSAWVADRADGAPLAAVALAATVPPSPTASATLAIPPTAALPGSAGAQTSDEFGVNLRNGAGLDYELIDTLPPNTPLQLVGRTADLNWLQVMTLDGRPGWILGELLRVQNAAVENLPVTWVEPDGATPVAAASESGQVILSGDILQEARRIFAHGQQLGNDPRSLLLIGDSVNVEGRFLDSFAEGNYTLGEYAYLQPTIDFFSGAGSLSAAYLTEHSGFKYDMILDPTWSNPALCTAAESPLDCEYRLKRPSIAIIHLALNDMLFYSLDHYRTYMYRVIPTLIGYGVIPVLTTFTAADDFRPELTPLYNQAIREVAAAYNIPLIDFFAAARPLPNRGTGEDGAHLSHREDWRIAFDGDQIVYGVTLRELLTWQMLDELKRNVLDL